MQIKKKPGYSFLKTIKGHGWYQLAPFEFDEPSQTLRFAFEHKSKCLEVTVSEKSDFLEIDVPGSDAESEEAAEVCVRHILRLDEPFEDLHGLLAKDNKYSWMHQAGVGPLLRSPTVFEDLVKTICTTNCSWALTKIMTTNLVSSLGKKNSKGKRGFPTAKSIAGKSGEFFNKEIRSGYRGPYLLELAEAVASEKIDPESWSTSTLTSAELKKEVKKVKGVGDYAAEHILKLIGRYDGLALDSFLRSEFYKVHNKGKPCDDKKIERHYKRFGSWKGLVIWFDMVENRASIEQ